MRDRTKADRQAALRNAIRDGQICADACTGCDRDILRLFVAYDLGLENCWEVNLRTLSGPTGGVST